MKGVLLLFVDQSPKPGEIGIQDDIGSLKKAFVGDCIFRWI